MTEFESGASALYLTLFSLSPGRVQRLKFVCDKQRQVVIWTVCHLFE